MLQDSTAASVLVGLSGDADGEITKAVQDILAAIPGEETDAVILGMLNSGEKNRQLDAIELADQAALHSPLQGHQPRSRS